MTRALPDVALRAPLPPGARALADALAPRLEAPQRVVMQAARQAGRVLVTAPARCGASTAAWIAAAAAAERGVRVEWRWCGAPPDQSLREALAAHVPAGVENLRVAAFEPLERTDAGLVIVDDAESVLDARRLPVVSAERVVWISQAVAAPDDVAASLDARLVDAVPRERLRVRVMGPFRYAPAPPRDEVEPRMADLVRDAAASVRSIALWAAPPHVVASARAVPPSEVRVALHGDAPGHVGDVGPGPWPRLHRELDEVVTWGGVGHATALARASAATAGLDKRGCVVRVLCRDARELLAASIAAEVVARGRSEQGGGCADAPWGAGPVALVARAALDAEMAQRLADGVGDELLALWLVDRFALNRGNAHAVVAAYRAQAELCGLPGAGRLLVAVFPQGSGWGAWVHQPAGWARNAALADALAARLRARAVSGDLGAGILADEPPARATLIEAVAEGAGTAESAVEAVFCASPPPLSDPGDPGWRVRP